MLLVAGVSTYADDPDRPPAAPEFVGNWAAGLGAAALGALILCYVGGVVSAFASSTALLPVIIPIAVPLIADGGISAGVFVAALAVSSTIVDVSPFSTNGALMLANRPDTISEEPVYYKQILTYSVHRGRRRTAARLGRPRPARAGDAMHGARTAGRHPRRRPDPRPRRPARRDDARRPRRPGDQGGGARAPATTPAAGGRRSSARGGDARESTYFLSANRNKESITLDLKDAADKDVLLALVDRADVLVENFRTGVLDRLGLGIEALHELNPRLVVLSITGFGHDGPEGGRAGYDQIAQGEAGLMSLTGSGPDDPQRVGVPIADLLAGMYGAYGVLAALLERDRTGAGTVVRTSLLAAIVGVHAFQGTRWTVAGEVGRAQGNHHPSIAPYGLFHCRDGIVQIARRQRGAVAAALRRRSASTRRPPGLATNAERVAHRERVIEVVEAAFADWSTPSRCWPGSPRSASPPARCARLDEVYAWDQVAQPGPAGRRRARRPSGRSRCPVRRCGSSTGRRRPR